MWIVIPAKLVPAEAGSGNPGPDSGSLFVHLE
jgi:hypothetical protein